MAQVTGTVLLEDVRIGFKNFAGAEGPYNDKGDRNFAVFLPNDIAVDLKEKGWNVKFPDATKEVDPERGPREAYLQVKVNFGGVPPKIVMIGRNVDGTEQPPALLSEAECEILDWSRTSNADLELRPYNWTVRGESGVKAYLKSIYVYVDLDPLESKYGI